MENGLKNNETKKYVREPMMVIDSPDIFLAMKDESMFLRKNI